MNVCFTLKPDKGLLRATQSLCGIKMKSINISSTKLLLHSMELIFCREVFTVFKISLL